MESQALPLPPRTEKRGTARGSGGEVGRQVGASSPPTHVTHCSKKLGEMWLPLPVARGSMRTWGAAGKV